MGCAARGSPAQPPAVSTVTDAAEYAIGAEVACSDGVCGSLSRVVIDPVARALTHLVVEPKHHAGLGRLVPIELADATAGDIRLRCTAAEFDALEDADETHFLTQAGEQMGYGAGDLVTWPYYGLGLGMGGIGAGGLGGMGLADMPQLTISDHVPAGKVEVRRGEHVHASDGDIGRVQGLVIDPKDHRVTHVLLEEGHLWGKKQITIPMAAVKEVAEEGVQLNLTKAQVRDLPPVSLGQR
jgi:sporulation protein YlmC with PRC-barrel domain